MQCRVAGCERQSVYRDQPRCEAHRLRWLPAQPVEPRREPAWLERMRAQGLPAKEMVLG